MVGGRYDGRCRSVLVLLRNAERVLAGGSGGRGGRQVAALLHEALPQGHGQRLRLRAALYKALDAQARRPQVLPAGHPLRDPHQYAKHGHRVPQSGPSCQTLLQLSSFEG